jgi:spermidine synthase
MIQHMNKRSGRSRGPAVVTEQIDSGTAELVPDQDRPGSWTLMVNGTPQSYVNLDDPTDLQFEYVRRLAAGLDTAAAPGVPLRVLHLGGGALTLPRYVAASRPKSAQRVVELDEALVAVVRKQLPLPRNADVRIRTGDGRSVVDGTADNRYDVVIGDVFDDARVPGRFVTLEFASSVLRILSPSGRYMANIADGPPLTYARQVVATFQAIFGEVCLAAEPAVLRGRRFGNLVLYAAPQRGILQVAELATRAARDPFPARVLSGPDLERFTAGAKPITDLKPVDSPPPPAGFF